MIVHLKKNPSRVLLMSARQRASQATLSMRGSVANINDLEDVQSSFAKLTATAPGTLENDPTLTSFRGSQNINSIAGLQGLTKQRSIERQDFKKKRLQTARQKTIERRYQ